MNDKLKRKRLLLNDPISQQKEFVDDDHHIDISGPQNPKLGSYQKAIKWIRSFQVQRDENKESSLSQHEMDLFFLIRDKSHCYDFESWDKASQLLDYLYKCLQKVKNIIGLQILIVFLTLPIMLKIPFFFLFLSSITLIMFTGELLLCKLSHQNFQNMCFILFQILSLLLANFYEQLFILIIFFRMYSIIIQNQIYLVKLGDKIEYWILLLLIIGMSVSHLQATIFCYLKNDIISNYLKWLLLFIKKFFFYQSLIEVDQEDLILELFQLLFIFINIAFWLFFIRNFLLSLFSSDQIKILKHQHHLLRYLNSNNSNVDVLTNDMQEQVIKKISQFTKIEQKHNTIAKYSRNRFRCFKPLNLKQQPTQQEIYQFPQIRNFINNQLAHTICQNFKEVLYFPGETIRTFRDVKRFIGIIKDGIAADYYQEQEIPVYKYCQGSTIGEKELIIAQPDPFVTRSEEVCQVTQIDQEIIIQLLKLNPESFQKFCEQRENQKQKCFQSPLKKLIQINAGQIHQRFIHKREYKSKITLSEMIRIGRRYQSKEIHVLEEPTITIEHTPDPSLKLVGNKPVASMVLKNLRLSSINVLEQFAQDGQNHSSRIISKSSYVEDESAYDSKKFTFEQNSNYRQSITIIKETNDSLDDQTLEKKKSKDLSFRSLERGRSCSDDDLDFEKMQSYEFFYPDYNLDQILCKLNQKHTK